MALITRLGRLFRADVNAVLDRIEEPDILLKQALREMEEDLHKDKQQCKSLQSLVSQFTDKLNETDKELAEVDKQIDLCFDSDENDLARSQVKKKLELQRYHKHCQAKLASTQKAITDLESRINENKTRLAAMQQKYELLVDEKKTETGYESVSAADLTIKEEDIDVAFLREKQLRGAS